MTKKKQSEAEKIKAIKCLVGIICSIVFYFLITRLLLDKLYLLKHNSAVIIYSQYIDFFGAVLVAAVAFFAINSVVNLSRKKKTIIVIILILLLLLGFIICGNAWIISDSSISKTVLYENKYCYSYDDIMSAELYITYAGPKGRHRTFGYTLHFNDESSVNITVGEGYLKSEDDLLSFDKRISELRTVEGKYKYVPSFSENLNNYYEAVWSG